MDFKLEKELVKHDFYGVGQIIAFDGKHILVKFDKEEMGFAYPEAFSNYLTFVDEKLQEQIYDCYIKKHKSTGSDYTSELSQIIDESMFEKMYKAFLIQADKNAISKKSEGGQTPFGFNKKPKCDGADISTHFGQGAASSTPYMNWWVVSIYYLPTNGRIILGIEETRYAHLSKMNPIRSEVVGNRKTKVAVFYETTNEDINYDELYEHFVSTCEEVMRLGLL